MAKASASQTNSEYRSNLLRAHPANPQVYEQVGLMYMSESQFRDAIEIFRVGLSIDPAHAKMYHHVGDCLKVEGKLHDAVVAYQMALCLDDHDHVALSNLGAVYKHLGMFEQAERCLTKSLKIHPDQKFAQYNLGIVYEQMWEFSKAFACFEAAILLDPQFAEPYRNKYLVSRQLCDFEKSSLCEPDLDRLQADDPFISIIRHEDMKKNLAAAQRWSTELSASIPKHVFTYAKRAKKDKIHIGYLSNDFRTHPIGMMTAPLFKLHNREKFTVSAYSYGIDDNSSFRKIVQNTADNFVDLHEVGVFESAQKINSDGVDILIDLTGYTENHRLEIMAYRPAKIQMTWLGFPGSLGAKFIDYIIADKIIIPEDARAYFSEKVLTLPHCYQINDNSPLTTTAKKARADFGLDDSMFVFASLNQSYKIDPLMWRIWMNILKNTQNSVLCLWQQAPESSQNLIRHAQQLGVDQSRLYFWDSLPKSEHLSRIKLIDVALDTRVYGGHTTTTDCIRMGVPVITKIGKHFASRVCASILHEVGLDELIANTFDEYEQLAISLSHNPKLLQSYKKRLLPNKLAQNICNTSRCVKSLESLYENCIH